MTNKELITALVLLGFAEDSSIRALYYKNIDVYALKNSDSIIVWDNLERNIFNGDTAPAKALKKVINILEKPNDD